MIQNRQENRQIVLQSRPEGRPVRENFSLVTTEIPKPGAEEMLLRTVSRIIPIFLSETGWSIILDGRITLFQMAKGF